MRKLLAKAGNVLVDQWNGPANLSPSLRLEWRFIAIRWLGIAFVGPGLALAKLPGESLAGAYAVLAIAVIYNLAVRSALRHRPGVIESGYVTTVADALLNVALITLAGGFDAPIYYICYTVIIAAAMRYGYGPAIVMALSIIASDLLEAVLGSRAQLIEAPFVFRSGFLLITAVLAGYLREQARRAQDALQDRLSQANLLNELTARLAASLDLETVLLQAVSAVAELFGSPRAVLALVSSASEVDAEDQSTMVSYPRGLGQRGWADLGELGWHYSVQEPADRGDSTLCVRRALPNKRQAMVIPLTSLTRQTTLAVVVLELPEPAPGPRFDPDILATFVERITLAIENASLYRAVASRSRDLQRAYADLEVAHDQLVRVDEMKTDFLANVSHEFRTPLTSIRSFAELLLSYEQPDAVRNEFLNIIRAESERLTRMVNDVLDVTRIESGNMDWQMSTLDPGEFLRDSVRAYVPRTPGTEVRFEFELMGPLPPIYGDRDRLLQVIGNLLNNAQKFTASGEIRLRAERRGPELVVSVIDSGVGIEPVDQERIFEKFQQVGAILTDKPRGTGLGLAICKEIVEYHGGRIWVQSAPGAGSTFAFAVPIMAESVVVPAESRPVARASVA